MSKQGLLRYSTNQQEIAGLKRTIEELYLLVSAVEQRLTTVSDEVVMLREVARLKNNSHAPLDKPQIL